MKLRWLLPPSNEAPGAPPYANRSELMTGKLPRPGVVPESCDAAGVSSPVSLMAWAGGYGDTGLPKRRYPPLGVAGLLQGKGRSNTIGARSTAEAAGPLQKLALD